MTRNYDSRGFDVLFRNLFDNESNFNTLLESRIPHPIDLYEDKEGLHFEVACTGLTKSDVQIDIEGDVLKINYSKTKDESDDSRIYQSKGIARRSFNLAYKIASKYNLADAKAQMENGLLIINVPFAETSAPKKLLIK